MALQSRGPTGTQQTTQLTLAVATTAWVPVLFNSKVWIPMNTVAANALNSYLVCDEISDGVAKTGEAWVAGDKIYYDFTNNWFTNTATGATLCAYAAEPKLSASATTPILFYCTYST